MRSDAEYAISEHTGNATVKARSDKMKNLKTIEKSGSRCKRVRHECKEDIGVESGSALIVEASGKSGFDTNVMSATRNTMAKIKPTNKPPGMPIA
jgi:hypothetical protein